jgi:hypothetical protein
VAYIDLAFRVQREIFYETDGDQSTKNVFAVCDRKGAGRTRAGIMRTGK